MKGFSFAIDGVKQAVVSLREDTPGNKRLVAYLIKSGSCPEDRTLTSALSTVLPEFMLPQVYVELHSYPLTPNGKVDRASLPAPTGVRSTTSVVPPSNHLEATIASHWKDALQLDQVGTRENFFDIGGHSLLVIDVMQRLNNDPSIAHQLGMVEMYRFTTVESIARHISDSISTDSTGKTERAESRAKYRREAMSRRREGRRRRNATTRNSA